MIIKNPFLIAVGIIGIFMLISFLRVLLGPKAPDRVVGLDTLNTMVVGSMVLLGAAYDESIYIDVGIVYALLSFVATLYISKYLEGSA